MISKGALERVADQDPGFYSRLFLVEKGSGGWRPVIDLSPLKEFVRQTPFRMETASSVLLSVRKGDCLASIDLKDAYFQVPVYHSSRKWLRFISEDSSSSSETSVSDYRPPLRSSHGCSPVSAWAHARYLDDWLVLASSEAKARQHVQDLLSLCHSLGIMLNDKKSELAPSRSVEYLGMTIDTVAPRAFPTMTRINKLLSIGRRFLAHQSPHAQLWQVLLGRMSSLEKLDPGGRLRMHSLQWQLKTHWFPETDTPPPPPPTLVDEDHPPATGKTLRDSSSGPLIVLRRVSIGVGSPPPRPICVGGMVSGGDLLAQQSPGDEGPVPSPSGIQGLGHGPPSDSDVRQLDSSGLCEQTRGDGL